MKKVYLFCSAGMSTSMLASKMQKVADDHQLPIEVEAFPDGKIGQIIDERHPDVILLGPQVKYRFDEDVYKRQVIRGVAGSFIILKSGITQRRVISPGNQVAQGPAV